MKYENILISSLTILSSRLSNRTYQSGYFVPTYFLYTIDSRLVSQLVEHTFYTNVTSAEVVVKSFMLVHKYQDNKFYAGGTEITNVSIDGHKVQCKISLRLVDNYNNTLDNEYSRFSRL